LVFVGVLLGVAFFTLMERKVLGYSHFRKGPTKIFYFGLFQPISDAVKLFTKEVLKGYKFIFYFFLVSPFVGFFLMSVLWVVFGRFFGVFGRFFSLVYVFCFMRLGVYFLLFSGWGSSSKYALFGSYRAVSQTVSYEVSIIFFILSFVCLVFFYDLYLFVFFQEGFWFLFVSFILFFSWIFVCVAERNRSPFDFSEGESELVSGFNVEYGGGLFSLIFICEYGMIIFLCFLRILSFFGGVDYLFKFLFLCFFFV